MVLFDTLVALEIKAIVKYAANGVEHMSMGFLPFVRAYRTQQVHNETQDDQGR